MSNLLRANDYDHLQHIRIVSCLPHGLLTDESGATCQQDPQTEVARLTIGRQSLSHFRFHGRESASHLLPLVRKSPIPEVVLFLLQPEQRPRNPGHILLADGPGNHPRRLVT